jgi:tetratricopeptide (TPR) repeat protein
MLTLLDDNSILAGGKNPDRDVYTVIARPGLERIVAIRLEALPDPSLPNNGPGRHPGNGNFYLNELRVIAGGAPVALSASTVDYDEFSESQQIIDGKIDGLAGWANAARAGEANTAIVSTQLHRSPNDELRIELHSPSPAQATQHNLGRFRLSVSGDPTIFAREQRRLAAMKLTDPWDRLAAAYHIALDQPALDGLLKAHPEAVTSIGDLYAKDNKWDQAVAAYSKAITPETKGATLLAKRAEAYEKLKQWDLAVADWTRAIAQQSDAAVDRFKSDDFRLWQLETSNGGAGSTEVVDGALVITTTAATGTNWHVQIYKAPVQLDNGVEYVIRFKMKSPDSCSVSVYGQIHQEDWHGIGLGETFVPPSEFTDYEFPFIPHDATPANNSISLQFGVNRGRVMIKEIVIRKKRDASDTALLAKRAAVYVAAEKWDLALAEWRQVVAHQPALMQSAYDQFQKADRFGEATEFGLQLVKAMPKDELVWLRVAPVLVLAGDQAIYSEFCDRMARQFAATKDPVVAERVVKAALLRPNSIDLGKLHGEILAKSLDDGTAPDWFPPWGFGSRALLAYRSGDAESAVKYMKRSEELKPDEIPHAMNLAVRAMAEHQLRHPEEARRALEAASQLINRLQADAKNKGNPDALDVQILYREAEALLSGKTKP